ncbi:unnamed protein product [Amoebophrya sp. A25]|nr:unnamed protein product [Amoebophrya sp. A25]|eukprot:GSA25T00007533001.1
MLQSLLNAQRSPYFGTASPLFGSEDASAELVEELEHALSKTEIKPNVGGEAILSSPSSEDYHLRLFSINGDVLVEVPLEKAEDLREETTSASSTEWGKCSDGDKRPTVRFSIPSEAWGPTDELVLRGPDREVLETVGDVTGLAVLHFQRIRALHFQARQDAIERCFPVDLRETVNGRDDVPAIKHGVANMPIFEEEIKKRSISVSDHGFRSACDDDFSDEASCTTRSTSGSSIFSKIFAAVNGDERKLERRSSSDGSLGAPCCKTVRTAAEEPAPLTPGCPPPRSVRMRGKSHYERMQRASACLIRERVKITRTSRRNTLKALEGKEVVLKVLIVDSDMFDYDADLNARAQIYDYDQMDAEDAAADGGGGGEGASSRHQMAARLAREVLYKRSRSVGVVLAFYELSDENEPVCETHISSESGKPEVETSFSFIDEHSSEVVFDKNRGRNKMTDVCIRQGETFTDIEFVGATTGGALILPPLVHCLRKQILQHCLPFTAAVDTAFAFLVDAVPMVLKSCEAGAQARCSHDLMTHEGRNLLSALHDIAPQARAFVMNRRRSLSAIPCCEKKSPNLQNADLLLPFHALQSWPAQELDEADELYRDFFSFIAATQFAVVPWTQDHAGNNMSAKKQRRVPLEATIDEDGNADLTLIVVPPTNYPRSSDLSSDDSSDGDS